MSSSSEKLQKLLAQAGYGSRRRVEQIIADGRVAVNGIPAKLGDRATRDDRISVDNKPVAFASTAPTTSVLIYNKPEGEICSRVDPQRRSTIYQHLPKLKTGRWISVGRLDINSSGLLLLTTDGALAHKLMHPSSQIDREYACRVLGEVDDAMLQRLRDGVQLEDGWSRFTDIVDGGGSGVNHWYYVVLMAGRNREVRRLWESQGIKVSRLKRVRYGPVFLPAKLRRGQWDELPADAVAKLYACVAMQAPPVAPLLPQQRQAMQRRWGKQ
jgi:23S rRNA pseudouridine2605 synthase